MSKRRQSLDLGSRGCARKGTRAKCRCLKVYSKAKDPTQNIHARRLLLEKVDANVVDVVDREDQPVELGAHFSVVLGCVMLVMHQECLLLLRHTEIEFLVHKILRAIILIGPEGIPGWSCTRGHQRFSVPPQARK